MHYDTGASVQGATARKSVELVCLVYYFFCNCARGFYYSGYAVMSATFGECCESTLGSYRVLHFYQHKIYNYNTCSFVQVDAFIVDI